MQTAVDQTQENTGSLRLTLVTGDGSPLNENVEIRLGNRDITDNRVVHALASQPLLIPKLLAFPHGLYEVTVFPEKSEIEGRFVNISPDQTAELCIVFHCKDNPPPPPPPQPDTCFQIPDTLTETDLTNRLRGALTTSAAGTTTDAIVWQDKGDEVVAHLSTLQMRFAAPAVFAAIDLESDQTGRHTLIVRFVFGDAQDPAGLFATTDEVVRGNSQLAARWGPIFRDLIWSALTRLSSDHAAERGLAPLRFSMDSGSLTLAASKSIPLPERVKQILNPPGTTGQNPPR
jgi:hypothetical protein